MHDKNVSVVGTRFRASFTQDKAATHVQVAATYYPDHDQRKTGRNPDNEDDATQPLRGHCTKPPFLCGQI